MSSSLFNTRANQLRLAKTDAVCTHAGENEEDIMKNNCTQQRKQQLSIKLAVKVSEQP